MKVKRYRDRQYDTLEMNLCNDCVELFFGNNVTVIENAHKDAQCEICNTTNAPDLDTESEE